MYANRVQVPKLLFPLVTLNQTRPPNVPFYYSPHYFWDEIRRRKQIWTILYKRTEDCPANWGLSSKLRYVQQTEVCPASWGLSNQLRTVQPTEDCPTNWGLSTKLRSVRKTEVCPANWGLWRTSGPREDLSGMRRARVNMTSGVYAPLLSHSYSYTLLIAIRINEKLIESCPAISRVSLHC